MGSQEQVRTYETFVPWRFVPECKSLGKCVLFSQSNQASILATSSHENTTAAATFARESHH